MGLLKKAIGGIGLYASQKKSQAEYSGPCQICGSQGVPLYAYDSKHLCRKCLDNYINKDDGKFRCYDCHAVQPRNAQYCSNCGRPLSLEAMKKENKRKRSSFDHTMADIDAAMNAIEHSDNRPKAIEDYRKAIAQAREDGVNLSSSHAMRVVNWYIKEGMNDKTWGYLNEIMFDYPGSLWKIRKEQCRICKKEKRWTDAAELLMQSHACKYGEFDRNAFLKDLSPIAKKLPLIEDEPEYLADMLSRIPYEDEYQCDGAASDIYRSFYSERLANRTGA